MKSTAIALATVFALVGPSATLGSDDPEATTAFGPVSEGELEAMQAATMTYWTEERMLGAIPREAFEIVTDKDAAAQALYEGPVPTGAPALHPGWDGKGPMPGPNDWIELTGEEAQAIGALPASIGVAPTNPKIGPYGPFQRFAMHGTYKTWPRSIHGKFFFTLGGGDFVCSATVVGKSIIITAGHCVSDGAGMLLTNALFCPGYTNGVQNPFMGCYAGWQAGIVPNKWHLEKDPDYDYACIVMPNTGTVVPNKVGIATNGWAGWAVNFIDVPLMTFGYPQAAPFNGLSVQQTASVQWYQVDFVSGGQVSNVIGSDLTGGASGGGWFLSWHAPGNEMPDTDGSWATDPANAGLAGPYITGVNSHKRCRTNCTTPPTDTAGVYWQEMTSPPFLDGAATDDFKSILDSTNCANHPANL
ncbi:MAG: hypothetical protein WAT23_06565 [Chromatiaceae bacterium]